MTLIRNLLLGVSLLALVRLSADDNRMSPELLWKLGRLGGATVSANGKTVAYTVRGYELKDDKGTSSLFLRHLDQDDEVEIVKDWPSIGEVQFGNSPFGERLFFVGSRGLSDDESPQAWSLNPLDGGLLQVTDIDDGVANLKVSPTGEHLAFTLEIKLDQEVTEIYEDLPKADARIIDSLMYRHWNGSVSYTHLTLPTIYSV